MATITKVPHSDGTVHFKARVRQQGQQRSKTFTTMTDAKRWARRVEVGIEQSCAGLPTKTSKTLSQAITRYRAEILPDKSKSAIAGYSIHLRYWEAAMGGKDLSAITGRVMAKHRDLLLSGRRPATVNRYISTLGSVFTACVRKWHWIESSPMAQVEKPIENNQRRRFLSKDELASLLSACKMSPRLELYPAVMLSISTGARQGEILGLRWCEVDLCRQVITLENTKNGDSRTLPIVDQVLPLLKAIKAVSKGPLVFPSTVSRNRPMVVRRSFITALRKAGIEDFRWHDLRHSTASFLAESGATLLEIGEVLGHRSMNTTKRYAHLTEKHSHKLMRGLADTLLDDAE